MKKQILLAALCLLASTFILNSCIKDTVKRTYTYTVYRPVYQTKPALRARIKSDAPQAVQQPGKLVLKDHYIFLNEMDKGIHVIDNTDPAQPKDIAFISIPGNEDIAIKGNTLYADLYSNLLTLDISDPKSVSVKKINTDVFPSRFYNGAVAINGDQVTVDSALMVTDYIIKDTTVTEKYSATEWKNLDQGGVIVFEGCLTCDFAVAPAASNGKSSSTVGKSGSTARFAIVGDRLYTVGNHEGLGIFNISDAVAPVVVSQSFIGLAIETIFPVKDKLFIGAANGMYIYDITNPDQPTQVSMFTHAESCDPVIVDGDQAYVTLRSGTVCNGTINQLDVLDIANLTQPALIRSYNLTHPHGLSKDGNLLFICDDNGGFKIFDATKPNDLQLLKTITTIEPYDVVADGGVAIVVAKDGLYQFDYSQPANVKQLSKLTIQ